MRKTWVIITALILSLSLAACGGNPTDSGTSDGGADNGTVETGSVDKAQQVGEGTLDEYAIKFTGASLAKDYEGNDVIVISYDFTNNGEEATSAMVSLYIQAFQDGVELDAAYGISGDDGYSADNSMKDLQTGATLNCQSAFVLTSTSPVEVEASPAFSFSEDMVTYTYKFAE